jgi:hypothetical protein
MVPMVLFGPEHVYQDGTMVHLLAATPTRRGGRHQSRQARLGGRPRPAHTDLDEREEQQPTTHTYCCCPCAHRHAATLGACHAVATGGSDLGESRARLSTLDEQKYSSSTRRY